MSAQLEREWPVDKSKWGPGPWQHEPDRLEFRHAGLACSMVRQMHSGHWCGYVAVPPGHPWHGKEDLYSEGIDVHVHGGITYARPCEGDVCHVPAPGEPDNVWWLGFDCAHAFDLRPGDPFMRAYAVEREAYRDLHYVKAETSRLAEQIAAAA